MIKQIKCAAVLLSVLVAASLQAQSQPTVTDADGNVYQTKKIGDLVWITENLKTTTFNDGTPIPHITDNTKWAGLTTPGYSVQENDPDNKDIYGALYNWYAVQSGKLCPQGRRVATEEDWQKLEIALGMSADDAGNDSWRGTQGGQLAGHTEMWVKGALKSAVDFGDSGFHGLPAGNRLADNGLFGNLGTNAYWWSATEKESNFAWGRMLHYGSTHVIKSAFDKSYGFSVRCVKDQAE